MKAMFEELTELLNTYPDVGQGNGSFPLYLLFHITRATIQLRID